MGLCDGGSKFDELGNVTQSIDAVDITSCESHANTQTHS